MKYIDFFAGIGCFSLALEKAGFEIVQTANLEHWVEQAISRDVILARKP